jgi:hypothetical protein
MTNESLSHRPDGKDITLVVEESQSFDVFDQWMDLQLEQLVARWIHTAAPNASRVQRGPVQIGHKNRVS